MYILLSTLLLISCNLNGMLKKSPEIYDFKALSTCLFTHEGSLTIISGPMYAGKTEKLIMCIKQAEKQGIKYLVFKHALDMRTEETLKSRAITEEIPCIPTVLSTYIYLQVTQNLPEAIFIDEAQFFSAELINIVNKILTLHINVIIAGLDTNFRREPFGSVISYFQKVADTKIRLQAKCNVCNKDNAEYTQRLVNGLPAKKTDPDIVIDDGRIKSVTYEPRCKEHHILQ